MSYDFTTIIRRCRRRIVLGRLLGASIDTALVGLCACLAFGTLAYELGLGAGAWLLFWIGLGLVSAAYWAREIARGNSLRAVAIRLDRELGLYDRVSSALVFSRRPEPDAFMRAHLRETAAFLQAHPGCSLPVPWPRRGRVLVLFLAIGLAAVLPHSDRARVRVAQQREIKERRARAAEDMVRQLDDLRKRARRAGLEKLERMIEWAERKIAEEMQILAPEDLAPPEPEPEPNRGPGPGSTIAKTAPEEQVEIRAGQPGQGSISRSPRLSATASYQPTGKFDSFPDSAYAGVFAELDRAIIGEELSAEQLEEISGHLKQGAGKISAFGADQSFGAIGAEGQMRNVPAEKVTPQDEHQNFDRAGLGLHLKAFSEFLNRYAAHLGERAMGRARIEMGEEKNTGGETIDIAASIPPPKGAKFAVKGVSDEADRPLLQGTPEQMARVAAQAGGKVTADARGTQVRGQGTSPGGTGAGAGGGGGRAAPVGVLPRAEGGEYLPLEGKLADGKVVLELIDERGHRRLAGRGAGRSVSYQDVYVQYAKGAEAELNGERVPLQMRDYIREYFRSIRPDAP